MYAKMELGYGPLISPQAIIANSLLQLSAEDLEQEVSEALANNPALDLAPPSVCRRCGSPLAHGTCPLCSSGGSRNASVTQHEEGWWNEDSRWRTRNTSYDYDDDFDPMTLVAAESTLSDHLWMQLAALTEPEESEVASFIANSLDERGFLAVTLEDIAEDCRCALEVVERVLAKVQTLDPPGVGARSVQECLLIQLAQLGYENGDGDGVAEAARSIIADCWDQLTKLSLDSIGRRLKLTEDEVSATIEFIGRNLNPFPANSDWRGPGPRRDTGGIRPDIIIRCKSSSESRYEIEIPDSRRYRLRVNSLYQEMAQDLRASDCRTTLDDREHLREHVSQARLFINCVRQRWQTLERIALLLVDIQEEFLEEGYRYLKPLTRSELADRVGVHESTVGRAVANKSVLLPNGRIIPLSDFFDGSLAAKCVIEDIVLEETHALSDQKISDALQGRGHDIARRTVAKYRDAIGIPPARVRAALKNRNWKPLWVPPEHAQAF